MSSLWSAFWNVAQSACIGVKKDLNHRVQGSQELNYTTTTIKEPDFHLYSDNNRTKWSKSYQNYLFYYPTFRHEGGGGVLYWSVINGDNKRAENFKKCPRLEQWPLRHCWWNWDDRYCDKAGSQTNRLDWNTFKRVLSWASVEPITQEKPVLQPLRSISNNSHMRIEILRQRSLFNSQHSS